MRTELLDGERLLADEMANLFRGWESVGGRLYVTNRRVIFESHFLNIRRGATEIPLGHIEDVVPRNNLGFIPNGMEIRTRDGSRYRFVTWGRRRLIDMIHVCKSDVLWAQKREGPTRRGKAPDNPAIQTGSSVEGTTPEEP